MKLCSKCNYKNDNDALLCNLCGERLPTTLSQDTSTEPHALVPKNQSRTLSRTQKFAEPERHFLVPPFGEPVPFPGGELFTIGRDDACTLRLTTPKASRRHAEIVWQESNAVLHDLGSQNGTWVNDDRLPPKGSRPLKDGDAIQIGDLIVTYKRLAAGVADETLTEGPSRETQRTPSLKARREAAATSDANLEGDASTFPIMDVLTKIAERNASGILTVEVEGAKGELRIEEGKAVTAKYPGLDGAMAIQVISSLAKGRFRFQAREQKSDTGKFTTLRATAGQPPATD